jgi:hypothetical protein
MTQAQIVRTFAADPAGVALLLAGPVADSLWPSAAAAHDADRARLVQIGPPMRAGVGFVVDLAVVDPEVGTARGRLALVPETAELPAVGTTARLTLTSSYGASRVLHERGEEFLDALGALAVARSSAA